MDDTRSRWSALVAFACFCGVTQLLWLNFAGATSAAARHFHVSETDIGWLAQVFPLLYVVLAIPVGLLLDKWFRPAVLAGAALTVVGCLVRLIGDDFLVVLAGQTLIALAQPFALNAITGTVASYLAERDRPAGIAGASAGTFAGMAAAFVLAAFLPDDDDVVTLSAIGAVLAVVAAVALAVSFRRPGPFTVAVPSAGFDAFRVAWGDPVVRRLCVLSLMPFGAFVSITTFAQALLEPAGVGSDSASTMLLIQVVAGVIGCATLPVLAARFGWQARTLLIGLSVTAAGCVALALWPGTVVGFLALSSAGFFLLGALPICLELVERRTGEAEGTASGLIWMSGNLGGLVVASGVGLLVDAPAAAFGVIAAVTTLGLLPALSLRSSFG